MFVAGLVLFLYFLPNFIVKFGSIGDALIIPDGGAVLAAISFSASFISYLFVPRKYLFVASLGTYLLLAVTTATLIFTTGNLHSSFISLWIVIAVFASVFGVWGVVPLFLAAIGDVLYVVSTSMPVPIAECVVLFAVGTAPLIASYIIFHIKARKRDAEDSAFHELTNELNQVSNKSDTVIKAIDDGVLALDSKGTIELINPAAQRIIGWGNSDAVGLDYKSVLKLTDKDSQALTEANDPVGQVLATGKDIHSKEFYATTGGGKRILLSMVISPIGQVGEGVIIVFRDITKEAAEEREQAEFISTASHEMRTPVASIEGYLGLALNPNTAQIDAKARDFIEKAHASAQHLGRLFQDLLDVSKADDGRLSNHPKVVDVVAYLADIVEGLRPKADEKGLRLYYKPMPTSDDETLADRTISPVFYVNVDNDHLREVVANLVENAVKYTPEGDVIIDVTGDDDHVKISVQDSGIGIAREDIPHLFQKFYRIDNSATREIGGTGLGLYLCRRLSEVMGGRLWLDSEFGKGSTFYLELPRLDREEAMRMIDAASTQIEAEAITTERSMLPGQSELVGGLPGEQASSLEEPVMQPVPVQPASAPVASPVPVQPTPVAPEPTPAQQPQPAQNPAPTLATIEQNAAAYAQQAVQSRAPGLQIPVRGPEPPPQK